MRTKRKTVPERVVADLPSIYEGLFKVAEDGRVYRLSDGGYILTSQFVLGNGYLAVTGMIKGKQHHFYAHRLVAELFVPKIDGKNIVTHKDGNNRNNHASNLEWIDNFERAKRVYENGGGMQLEVSGKPCQGCGEPTFSKRGLCGKCRYNSALKAKTEKRLEEKFEEINFILENTDLENLKKNENTVLSMRAQGYTFAFIASELRLSKQRVHQLYQRLKAKAVAQCQS